MKMKNLFTDINMSWKNVILFALGAGIYTGLIMQVPALVDTSFQDIGIQFEFWVIFAVIIVANCRKSTEAMLKCFVFFLISQPLIYLVEVLCGYLPMEMALNNYRYWFKVTLLTLPGGFIAYYVKKQNLLGALILGCGNTIQAVMGCLYIILMRQDFPHHMLSAAISFLSIAAMSICIQKDPKNRMIAGIVVPGILLGILLLGLKLTGRVIY